VRSELPVFRVFLVDEHEVVRRGVAKVLEGDTALKVVGEAGSVSEALRRAPAVQPDVAVVAMRFPDGSGAHLCEGLLALFPRLRCMVLSDSMTDELVHAAMRAGASGYLGKHVPGPVLLAAVRRVASGETLFDREAALSDQRAGCEGDRLAPLTDQERTLLQLIAEGLSNQQIADQVGLATKTVKNYVSHMLGKLGLANRTQAAILATQLRNDPRDDDDPTRIAGTSRRNALDPEGKPLFPPGGHLQHDGERTRPAAS
jgi:two-component system, NarL family, response regulator DevR